MMFASEKDPLRIAVRRTGEVGEGRREVGRQALVSNEDAWGGDSRAV